MEKHKDIDESSPVSIHEDLLVSEKSLEVVTPIQNDGQPITDWERGLIGWDSENDPANPLYEALIFCCSL